MTRPDPSGVAAAASPGRLRSIATVALFWSTAVVALLGVWRRLAPPESFKPPSALTADMIFVATGPANGRPQGFFIDRFETTRGAFESWRRTEGGPPPNAESRGKNDPPDVPVSKVTYREATAYAAARGKRLPTADEWDLAARSPGGVRFPWGDGFVAACANTWELGMHVPVRVGTFEGGRTASGVYDLFGNVAEWTSTVEPGGVGVRRRIVGSSFFSKGAALAPGTGQEPRRAAAEDSFSFDVGFRCAADLEAAEADRGFRAAIAKLAVRDPAGVLLQRLPAERLLRRGGAGARRLLLLTIDANAADPDAARFVSRCRALVASEP